MIHEEKYFQTWSQLLCFCLSTLKFIIPEKCLVQKLINSRVFVPVELLINSRICVFPHKLLLLFGIGCWNAWFLPQESMMKKLAEACFQLAPLCLWSLHLNNLKQGISRRSWDLQFSIVKYSFLMVNPMTVSGIRIKIICQLYTFMGWTQSNNKCF